ncbi:MAG: polysaccharide deacetylase family protein, partial [Deltaproteobacteria bacterium]|nr:polysaccharide deacetylase family protein [Deltaproteobacteria bacterium]
MKIWPGKNLVKAISKRGANADAAAGLILMYHKIGELPLDPWGLAVSPSHFAEHLEILCKHGWPLHLAQAVRALQHKRLTDRTLVVTFDDGYANNFHNAAPLLERYDVPATVFVTTGYIGGAREFWWDALEGILLRPEVLPAELRLTAAGRIWHWSLAEAQHYGQDLRRSDREWSAAKQGAPSGRYDLYRMVHRVLQPLHEDERGNVLDHLRRWAGVAVDIRESHRCLLPSEVVAFGRMRLIEIGAHTATHPVLPMLSEASQREEIRQSKLQLERMLGCAVTSFAYPYGQYAAATAALVRQEGFSSACATQAGLLSQHSDLFRLPRVREKIG